MNNQEVTIRPATTYKFFKKLGEKRGCNHNQNKARNLMLEVNKFTQLMIEIIQTEISK